ncbi:MAG: Type III pantothenate kinase [Syntrophomonadaceae bacterium]|nr:Type III pantothenate kinase [Bacillota bacterium]
MLLTIDIGNTTINLGIFEQKKLSDHCFFPANKEKTALQYRDSLLAWIAPRKISAIIISSVVPSLTEIFTRVSKYYLRISPILVTANLNLGLKVKYSLPEEVGIDRLVNAVAAYHIYRRPLIIVDFGTATTFSAVSMRGEYLGGAIAPGIKMSLDSLHEKTASLPQVELSPPENVIGRDTVTNIQSGVIYGFAELAAGIIKRMKVEFSPEAYVIATGGWALLIARECPAIDEVNQLLALKGLRIIYEKVKRD